jgi:AcrR family transcriptional regulator
MSAAEISSPKRDHLMATAWRLFYRDGYRAVGIDMILAEAGVAKMTLYNHFSSKDELIIAVLEKRDCELRASIIAQVEATAGSPSDRLLAVFDWLETWFGSSDFNGCAFIRALSEYPDTTHPIHQTAWRHKVAMQGALTIRPPSPTPSVCSSTARSSPPRPPPPPRLPVPPARAPPPCSSWPFRNRRNSAHQDEALTDG